LKLMLKSKLLLLLVAVSLITIILAGIILTFSLRYFVLQMIREDYESQLGHIDFAIYNFFRDVENDIETIASIEGVRTKEDSEFTNFLNADKEKFQYNIGSAEQEIIDIFNSYRTAHPYVNSVYMGRENGSFVRSHKRAEPTQYDPRERPWYINAKESPDKVVMTEPYSSLTTPDINIGVEKALVDENGIFFGVVGADITLENLTNYISDIKVGENGWAILISENGSMLVGRNEEDLFKNISELEINDLNIIMEESEGYAVLREDSKKSYIFFDTSEELGWKIGLVIPVEEVNDELWTFIFSNIGILAFSLFIVGLLILLGLSKFVINPIRKLSDRTVLIAETGNLDHSVEIESRDEIGCLGRSFNEMMETISQSNKALKNSEKALKKLNNELEEKIKKRTGDLTLANERLKELDKLKSMFIASMSHELRTPLNSIIGFTSLILMGMAGKINAEQKKQLLMVKSSANHLLELVNDVIDVSKIEADQIDLSIEDFNLFEILNEIKDSFKILAEQKGLNLVLKAPEKLIIRSDRRRVKQVIMNFVSNAIKFTGKGEIVIKAEEIKGMARVTVSDTGTGIRKKDMKKLFKQFSRIYVSGEPIVEGTGLGLYLSKKIAILLKGNISVESVFGKGSKFIFDLPL
jgi:signal transduction histidine kinase